jgi:uncharacterized protein
LTEQNSSPDQRGGHAVTAPVADPAPLGFAAFAVTIFLLSAANAGWMRSASGDVWLSYAFSYGGLVLLLAGMWEFRNRNVFGATAFSTYGGFWIGLALWAELVAPKAASGTAANQDVAWILLAFAIFNTYMLLWSTQVSMPVFAVFVTVEATEVILTVGSFQGDSAIIKVGGYVGVLTAACAWFVSAAGVLKGMRHSPRGPEIGVPPQVHGDAEQVPQVPDVTEQVVPQAGKLQVVAERLQIQVVRETVVYEVGESVTEEEGDYYLIVREPEHMLVDVPGADQGVFWDRADAEKAAVRLSKMNIQSQYEIHCVGSNDVVKGVVARYQRGDQAP